MKTTKLFIAMFVIVSLFSVGFAFAEDGTTEVTILNSAPTVDTLELNDASSGDETMTLTAANTTTITCNGTASDADGNTDITGVSGVIWSTNSTYGGVDAPATHYTDSDCGYAAGTFSCSFDVQFYADATSWTCNATATDNAAENGSLTDTATINQLIAINIPDATHIDFGSLAVGQNTSLASLNVTYENEGNVIIDVDVDAWDTPGSSSSANSFNCTVGNLPIANFRASLVQGAFATYTQMTQSGYVTFDSNLAQQTTGSTPTNDDLFFGLEITSGVSGTCTGVVSVQGVAG